MYVILDEDIEQNGYYKFNTSKSLSLTLTTNITIEGSLYYEFI